MADEGLDVQGRDELKALGVKLKALGDREIKAELKKTIVAETKATRHAVKREMLDVLPKKGGLNKWAARVPKSTTRTSGRNVGVSISMNIRTHDVAALNRGRLRHPVFGNREAWVNQPIAEGWFKRPIMADAPRIREAILAAIRHAASRTL